jgi:histidyl-tRNA synthetase
VAVLGADERANGVVTIKDMTSGKQKSFPRGELPARLAAGADEALAGVTAPSEQAQ